MQSIRSKLIIFLTRNRQIFKGRLKRERFTEHSSIEAFREYTEKAAARYAKIPKEISIQKDRYKTIDIEWFWHTHAAKEKIMFYVHGGGLVSGSLDDHRAIVAKFVSACSCNAFHFNYRLAPEHPFPAALEDTLLAYSALLEKGYNPKNIVFVGESAGGGLALAALIAIRDRKIPLPAACAALSPWLDLHASHESHQRNKFKDISLIGSADIWGKWYMGDSDPKNPWHSPLYADVSNLPPLFIQTGTAETLHDEAPEFANKAKKSATCVQLSVWKNMVHCFALFSPLFPEAKKAWSELRSFIVDALK